MKEKEREREISFMFLKLFTVILSYCLGENDTNDESDTKIVHRYLRSFYSFRFIMVRIERENDEKLKIIEKFQ